MKIQMSRQQSSFIQSNLTRLYNDIRASESADDEMRYVASVRYLLGFLKALSVFGVCFIEDSKHRWRYAVESDMIFDPFTNKN